MTLAHLQGEGRFEEFDTVTLGVHNLLCPPSLTLLSTSTANTVGERLKVLRTWDQVYSIVIQIFLQVIFYSKLLQEEWLYFLVLYYMSLLLIYFIYNSLYSVDQKVCSGFSITSNGRNTKEVSANTVI